VTQGADIRDPEVSALAGRARSYVDGFSWCAGITGCTLGFAVADVLGVFRVDLRPARAGVDPTVSVVVGDLPPAYIAYEHRDTWQDALLGYVDEMQAWVDAVRAGGSVDELIPVNVAPTAEYAEMLASRLAFLRERLVDVDAELLQSDV
jgi:hypothetical protein